MRDFGVERQEVKVLRIFAGQDSHSKNRAFIAQTLSSKLLIKKRCSNFNNQTEHAKSAVDSSQ